MIYFEQVSDSFLSVKTALTQENMTVILAYPL